MKTNVIASIGAALVALSAFGTSLTLDEDLTIDVQEGQTTTYTRLLGTGHTLTKTGAGTLVINRVCNETAVIDIKEGAVKVLPVEKPEELAGAVLHLDAECGLVTSELNGTNFVSRWNDVRSTQTSIYATAQNKSADGHFAQKPFLRAPDGVMNKTGRSVVETGPMKTDLASCFWVVNGPLFAEAFVVAMDTEDVKTLVDRGYTGTDGRASPFIGQTLANWLRGNRSTPGVNSAIAQAVSSAQDIVYKASFELDGQTTYAGATVNSALPYPDGFHLLNVRPTESIYANYLSSDRGKWEVSGGHRLGAVVLFAEQLSSEVREKISDYLLSRWVPQRISRVIVAEGASFAAETEPQLLVGEMVQDGTYIKLCDDCVETLGLPAGVSDLDVRAGRYDGRVFVLADAWMHVDASRTESLTMTEENGTNFVTRWSDVSGGSRYAEEKYQHRPFLKSDALNGLPVVDFGEFWCGDECTAEGRWGGSLKWSETCKGIRDVFTVVMDTEDLKRTNATWKARDDVTYKRASPFVGCSSAHFYRGNRTDTAVNSTVVNGGGNTGSYTSSVDGGAYASASSTVYPDGFHVLHLKTNREDSNGDSFTRERSNSRGGQRIAEFMVCNAEVSDADAARVVNYLRAKWFNAGTNKLSLVNVAVADGAEVDLEKLTATGLLTIDGTLRVTEVSASAIKVTGERGMVKGCLKLASSGTLTVDWPKAKFREAAGREVRILGFDAVEGDLSGWNVSAPKGCLTGLTLKTDGIYATLQPKGMLLLFR